jgi:beta-RFAP synthase
MAVAKVVTLAAGRDRASECGLARLVGRGDRSAVGTHGFSSGGLLVEGGKRRPGDLSPLVVRVPFPENWRVVLVLPPVPSGLHGERERRAFESLPPWPLATIDALSRLVLLGMLPALAEEDVPSFGEALYDFNVRVGQQFAAIQGGTYAHPAVAQIVAWLREQGISGVGQSSWGPTVFATVSDQERADTLAQAIRRRFALDEGAVWTTAGCNDGVRVEHHAT